MDHVIHEISGIKDLAGLLLRLTVSDAAAQ